MEHYRSLDESMVANVTVDDDNWWTRLLRKHPNVQLAVIPAMVGALLLLVCWQIYTPPEFSVTVSRPQGLEPPSKRAEAEGAPTFDVTLRAKNRNVWEHCFKPGTGGSAVVAYDGVPLARADLPGFCVPGMGVAKVRFVAAGGGLGIPESLYESLEAQRGRRERVQLTVRVRLDDDRLLPHHVPDASRFAAGLVSGGDAGRAPPEQTVTLHDIRNVVKLEYETVVPLSIVDAPRWSSLLGSSSRHRS